MPVVELTPASALPGPYCVRMFPFAYRIASKSNEPIGLGLEKWAALSHMKIVHAPVPPEVLGHAANCCV